MGLRGKFNAVLVSACLAGIVAATSLSYWMLQDTALQEIEEEIALLRSNALAVRHFTTNDLTPLLQENNEILFLPQSVPSFTAQYVFSKFQESFPDYSYKEAALNPTNPDDLAVDWEVDLINQLRDDPGLDRVTTVITRGDEEFFTVAFPFTIKNEGCLICHSVPEAAPPAMVDLYGEVNGFGWQMDETIGAQIISAPMSLATERAQQMMIALGSVLSIAFLLVLIIANLMLKRIVLRPVTAMTEVAEKVSMGDFNVPEYVKPGTDEISSLSVSFNRMRRSLESAMKLIDE